MEFKETYNVLTMQFMFSYARERCTTQKQAGGFGESTIGYQHPLLVIPCNYDLIYVLKRCTPATHSVTVFETVFDSHDTKNKPAGGDYAQRPQVFSNMQHI